MAFHPLRQRKWTHGAKHKHSIIFIIFLNIYFGEEL